ncbi:lipase family protein [Solidesulfovibrio sp.]|uniref:lipase family protein n=1 Tax=Solidesulfovibrio sp. TaxID=2910990 RepID=UPI002B21DA2A|nr:alpha/beta hydrolase [Solidesulfovibrio sp.]MEA4857788.1 alpha/beta hydrolase [Solidesulfovibrio sp.]
MADVTGAWTTVPLTAANLETVLAVVADAAYRDDATLVSGLEAAGLAQLDLTGGGSGTYLAGNAAFDAWTTVVNNEPAAIIAFRGTDDIDYSLDGISAYKASQDAVYWLDTKGYYDLLADGVSAFDAAVSALGIRQVYVTGHSLGGAAAQAYMAEHPDTATTSYTAVTFGSLGLTGDGAWATDGRIANFADASDFTNSLGTQTAGLTITVAKGESSLSSGLDLATLISDPASYLTSHSIELFADDAARYDAAKAGLAATDTTTFFTATVKYGGLTVAVSSSG